MATVKPFKALRPYKGIEQCFSCPPYDVLEEDEVKEIISRNPNSFLRVTRSEVEAEEDSKEAIYKKAKENLESFIKNGVLIKDSEPSFYIYRETWQGVSQTGFFAVVSVDEYDKGIIKKHELTRRDKEDDRTNHILNLNAQTGPVFLTYKAQEDLKAIIDKLIKNKEILYSFCDENNVKHELIKIQEEDEREQIEKAFNSIEYLYIVDGHHRAAAASRVQKIMKEKDTNYSLDKPYNYFMAAIFPHNELRILPYNRIVKDLNGLKEEEFLKKISSYFQVEEAPFSPYSPDLPHSFGMYLQKKWYKLTFKGEESEDPVENLDVHILQKYLLDPILSIKDPRTDPRIYFLGGIRGVKEIEKWIDKKDWMVGFSMYPTQIDQLLKVAEMNKIMPPKSTWFEPKLRSGLLIHELS
ncbi:SpoOJ/ParA/ParB/repB family protein [Petrotoga mexicana DSM 14811]|uniref:SpoOJ/ParA/ParB/repB family protein n=1 Tax=Petrotoga mexicana DSM 14811 TaxID=1122954 RepID=A0A2K1P9H4_9BACT|nr:DUF1015 family protein [Petrotoga mexicana]PNR99441.1 SpoOJ/ParA/ParB/repB family protein [Petrotoga mexicana DSM 14811]